MSFWLQNILTTVFQNLKQSRYILPIMKRPHELDTESPPEAKVNKTDLILDGTRGFRKCAILMVYSGTGYYGMQKYANLTYSLQTTFCFDLILKFIRRNEGFKTIEGELLSALHNAGYITKEHVKNQQLVS